MTTAEKLFTVAGTATDRGVTKVRFANDLVARIKILNKSGCTNIDLVELPSAMTKLDALIHLQSLGTYEGDAAAAIAEKIAEKSRLAKRASAKATLSQSPDSVATLESETTDAVEPAVVAETTDAVEIPAAEPMAETVESAEAATPVRKSRAKAAVAKEAEVEVAVVAAKPASKSRAKAAAAEVEVA